MKRVLVTGMGAVTPLGDTFEDSWKALKAGKDAIGPITRFDPSEIPWKKAGEIKSCPAEGRLFPKDALRLDPFVLYAFSAARMALEDSGLGTEALERAGVVIGSSRGGVASLEAALMKRPTAYLMSGSSVGTASSFISERLGIKGYMLGISNACPSGSNAIGEAARLIRHGVLKTVFAGGAEAPLCTISVRGYGVSGALSKKNILRPFDKERDGFILGEGACVLVLEEYSQAMHRGARPYGEVLGYGNSVDAFHQTRPDPLGQAGAIRAALEDAKVRGEEIKYINAHGTGTPLGDASECAAIRLALGQRAPGIKISSIKAATGHMLGASGAFEAGVTIMCIKEGIVPATLNLKEKDPGLELDFTTKTERAEIGAALSNSFGFGGANSVLVLGPP